MFTREELLRSNTYWIETIQNELYSNIVEYMEKENLNQIQLAEKLGVTKGYVSQLLNGKFNFTLKKLVELSLAIGKVPNLEFEGIEEHIERDSSSINGLRNIEINIPAKVSSADWHVWNGITTKKRSEYKTMSVSVDSNNYSTSEANVQLN